MNEKELLKLLAIAVDEAETWFEDEQGASGKDGLPNLAGCYEALEAAGFKTKRTHPVQCEKANWCAVIIDGAKTVA